MPDTGERQAAVAEWKRLSNEPGPPPTKQIGCMTLIVAIGLGALAPTLLGWLGVDLGKQARGIMAGVFLAIALLGALVWFFGPGRFARDLQKAEEAIEWLAKHGAGGDPIERRNKAVAVLYHAYCVDGPSTVSTFNFTEARSRLGDALSYVIEVERALVVDAGIYRVFTDDKVRLPG